MEQVPQSQDIKDLLKDSRTYEQVDRERVEVFQSLIVHPGWKAYHDLLMQMIEDRGAEVLAPAGSIDGAMKLEYIKGAMSGLILARDLPHVSIASMKSVPATDKGDLDE